MSLNNPSEYPSVGRDIKNRLICLTGAAHRHHCKHVLTARNCALKPSFRNVRAAVSCHTCSLCLFGLD